MDNFVFFTFFSIISYVHEYPSASHLKIRDRIQDAEGVSGLRHYLGLLRPGPPRVAAGGQLGPLPDDREGRHPQVPRPQAGERRNLECLGQ